MHDYDARKCINNKKKETDEINRLTSEPSCKVEWIRVRLPLLTEFDSVISRSGNPRGMPTLSAASVISQAAIAVPYLVRG